jgi:hypothetical protein
MLNAEKSKEVHMTVSKQYIVVVGIFVCFMLRLLPATDFDYIIEVDTGLYKAKAFQSTITGTADELFGTVLNTYQTALYKVAIIDFGITNGSSGITFDLVIDSIYIRTYKNNVGGYVLFGQSDILRFSGVGVSRKECASFRTSIDYPHTDNDRATYIVKIRIFGSYE